MSLEQCINEACVVAVNGDTAVVPASGDPAPSAVPRALAPMADSDAELLAALELFERRAAGSAMPPNSAVVEPAARAYPAVTMIDSDAEFF